MHAMKVGQKLLSKVKTQEEEECRVQDKGS